VAAQADLIAPAERRHPRWRAHLALRYARCGAVTGLTERRHEGPLRIQRPFHPEGDPCHTYVLHPPGGVVGGDQLEVDLAVDPDAWAVVTSPGATKFYRSLGDEAVLEQRLDVAPGGTLEWLPQEQIAFAGAIASSTTRIDLQAGSRCLAWELNCLGRPAGGYPFDQGCFRQRMAVWRDGVPLLLEHARLRGGTSTLTGQWGLGGAQAMATLIAAPADKALLTMLREALAHLPGEWAATLVDDLLVLRWRGAGALQAYALRLEAWRALRPVLLGRPVCVPRIWNT
jgi:urease accessory protein